MNREGVAMGERGFRLRALGEIAIRCADLEAMTVFYRDVLGLPVLEHGHREGIVFFALGASYGGHTAVLALFADDRPDAPRAGRPVTGACSALPHVALALGAEEQAAAEAWLRARSLPVDVAVFDWIGWRGVFTKDPEGTPWNWWQSSGRARPGRDPQAGVAANRAVDATAPRPVSRRRFPPRWRRGTCGRARWRT